MAYKETSPAQSKLAYLISESIVIPKIIFLITLGVFIIIFSKVFNVEIVSLFVDGYVPYLTVQNHFLGEILSVFAAFSSTVAAFLLMNRWIYATRLFALSLLTVTFLMVYKLFIDSHLDFYDNIKTFAVFVFHISLVFYSLSIMKKGWFSQMQNSSNSTVSLTVQKGCNYSCAYCEVPLKGRSESDLLHNIVNNAKIIEEEGVKEIVLTGGNIGDYGKGELGKLKHEHTFLEMLQALDKVGGIERFRISSVTTPLISDDTLNFIKNSIRFSPHFEIRMQSGSDEVLKKMNRPFMSTPYKELVERIKKSMPNAFISIQVIVGFPGETEALFQETVDFLKGLDISFIEVLAHTNKRKTEAAHIKNGIVSKAIRLKRRRRIIELSKEKRQSFYESQIETTHDVLFEMQNRGEFIFGLTENNIRVKTPWDSTLLNTVSNVKLISIDGKGIVRFEFVQERTPVKTYNYSI